MACYQNILGIFPNFFDFKLHCVPLLQFVPQATKSVVRDQDGILSKATTYQEADIFPVIIGSSDRYS